MRLKVFGAVFSTLLSIALTAPEAVAQRRDRERGQDWVQLGCQDVSFRGRDRDTIRVGRREGRFRAIRLTARGNDIEMRRLTVVYANGNPDELDVQRVVRRGSKTEALDLKGRDRAIERIDMTYRQRDDFPGRASVCVEGLMG